MSVDLSKFDNSDYKPGGNKLVRLIWFFTNRIVFNSYLFPIYSFKVFTLKLFGAKMGKGIIIKPKVNIKYPWKLTIGDNSWIGEKAWIDNLAQVTIGSNCCISQDALILCGNHDYKKSTFDLIAKPITIKNGAWVGAKAVACNGVTIGENTLLSVGSIATNDLKADSIYQGNPAIRIKDRKII